MTHTAFFYGTLMAPPILHRVIYGPLLSSTRTRNLPTTITVSPALLPDYQRHRVLGADYPGILENRGSCVRGTVVTGLTDGDVWRLDQFEGSEYVRKKVVCRVLDAEGRETGEEREAETYVWVAGRAALEEGEWDFDEFVKEKMWRWTDEGGEKEGEYTELDDAVKVQESGDDPTRGRMRGGPIHKTMEEEWAKISTQS